MDSPPTQERDDSSTGSARQAELDRLAEEFVERERRGEQPSISQYVRAHPTLAEGIEDIFPVLAAMEDARRGRQQEDGPPREELGDYRLLREIGRGGMGVVYEAEQKTLGRRVALKILPTRATLDPRFLERFRLEAQSAARLQHPNIVPVIGYGLDDGVHYFTMQYIEGRGLDEVIADARTRLATQGTREGKVDSSTLGPTWFQDVARMGLQAAEALAHAHAHGVLHRDVKPGNLMLDDQGKTWVTDFGLCKEEGSGDLTQPGDLLGTFRYMAPERFHGESDVRGDIYGVGITLYELLARTPAYEDDDRATLAARILKEQPKRLREHDPRIPADLERIVLKAMAHDAALRYPTAEALAADLRAFLEGRPITARTPSLGYMLRVAIRRHRALAFTLTAAALLLVATSVYYVLSLREKEAEARFRHYVASIAAAETALRDRDPFVAKRLLSEAPAQYRNFEWHHLRSRLDRSLRDYPRRPYVIERLGYSPDGKLLAIQAQSRTWIFDVATLELVRELEHEHALTRGIKWHPSGRRFAVATSRGLEIWSWPDAERLHDIRSDHVRDVAFTPDGTRVITGGHSGRVEVRDSDSMAVVLAIDVHSQVYALDVHPDGDRVVTGSWDGRVTVWSLADGAHVWTRQAREGGVHGVAFVGRDLVAGTAGGGVAKVWRAADGALLRTLGHVGNAHSLWAGADGAHLFVAAAQQVHVWNAADGTREAFWLHDGDVKYVVVHPDGSRFAAGSSRGSVKEWPLPEGGDPDLLGGHVDGTAAMDYAPSGAWIATSDEARVIRLWDAAQGELARTWIGHRGGPKCIRFSHDSTLAASCDHVGEVLIWSVPEGRLLQRLEAHRGWANGVAFSQDDARLFSVGDDGMLCVFDVATGERLQHVRVSEDRLHALAVSDDGRWCATGGDERVVTLWDARTLEIVRTLAGHEGPIMSLAFQPGDEKLASACYDRTARIWAVESGALLHVLRTHQEDSALYPDVLRCITFSPDGTRVAAGSHDASLMLWDTSSGQLVATLREYTGWVNAVAFSPDGESLVAASGGPHVRVTHTLPLRERLPGLGRDPAIRTAARRLVAALTARHEDTDAVLDALAGTTLTQVGVAQDGVPPAAVREAALRMVHRRRGSVDALIDRLWRVLLPREGPELERRVALGVVQGLSWAAEHMSLQDSRRETLLCLALVRNGDPRSVIDRQARSVMLNQARHPDLFAVDLAVLTLAYSVVDDAHAGAQTLQRLDALLGANPALRTQRVERLRAEARGHLQLARQRALEAR